MELKKVIFLCLKPKYCDMLKIVKNQILYEFVDDLCKKIIFTFIIILFVSNKDFGILWYIIVPASYILEINAHKNDWDNEIIQFLMITEFLSYKKCI